MLDRLVADLYLGLRREWRQMPWTVLSVVALWLLMVAVYFVVYPSLARSEDLKPINSRLTLIIIKQFDAEIMAAQKDYCRADTKEYFAARLIDLKRQYKDLTNGEYPTVPNCQELK